VLGKLVQPKDVIVPTPADPVLVHPGQQVVPSEEFERRRDDITARKGEDGLGLGPSLRVVGRGHRVVPAVGGS